VNPLAITAFSVVSAAGDGRAATLRALVEERSGLRPCPLDAGVPTYVGRVDAVEDGPLPDRLAAFEGRNARLALRGLRADGFENEVARAVGRYGSHRVGLFLGTTTAGILEGETAFRERDPVSGSLPPGFSHRHTIDHFSTTDVVRSYLGLRGPAFTVSTACSSSSKVFGDATQLIAANVCDAAVVGGADSLSLLTLRGFASLELLSREPCRPNDAERAGISIGEAAAFFLLERDDASRFDLRLLGYGDSCDAYHMSSPDPAGAGAALSMRMALRSARLEPGDIDYVNLHGTGTLANDAAESTAVHDVFGGAVPCSSSKGLTGHALGAAGAVEAAICCLALEHGVQPGNANLRRKDPSFRIDVVPHPELRPLRRVLSNSFGFGGNNCTLAFGRGA
jgi:3-oxoacyl-[acyl-carrier-protein] synthase-1